MSWRSSQQSKPWPWPNAVYLEENREDASPTWGNSSTKKYDNPEGQILGGTVYKNAFPVPGDHYIYKSKKKFKDKYAKNKAKFEKKTRLPPITEAMSEVSSKAGSTRSTHSWMIPRYNPDILSDVMASDDSDSEDEDYTSGRSSRKYRKSGRKTNNQPPSLRHVDVIRNVQTKSVAKAQPKNTNVEVWPPESPRNQNSPETNKNYDGLHRTQMNGDALLANQLLMNNGSVYKEKHPLGISQDKDDESNRVNWTDNLSRQQSNESGDVSKRQSTRRNQRRRKARNNGLVTSLVITIIIILIGAGIAAYMLLRDSSDDADTTSPPPVNIKSLKYNIILHLKNGNFSSLLRNNEDPTFIALTDEVCRFLYAVPMRNYLDIYTCKVLAFREGSILSDTEVSIREDDITVLKAQNAGLTATDIVSFIVDDITKQIIETNSQTVQDFVEKYNASVTVPELSTTVQPTTDFETSTESSAVTPSMSVTTEESPVDTTPLTSVTTEKSSVVTSSTTEQTTPSTTDTSSVEATPVSSEDLSNTAQGMTSVVSSGNVSSSEQMHVSPTVVQTVMESSSTA